MVRRKLEIKKIQDKSKRQVTFTKRRQGLFRKANELCKKCDAQIAIITFSLAGNVYAWGHPTVDSILKRYMDHPAQETDDNRQENKSPPYDKDPMNKRDMDLSLSLSLSAYEEQNKKSGEKKVDHIHERVLDLMMMASLDHDLAGLQMHELEQLIVEMEDMQKKIVDRANQMRSSVQVQTSKSA